MCKVTYNNEKTKLIGELFQFLEVLDDETVVTIVTSIEFLPDSSHDGSSAKSVVLYFLYIMRVDTAQCDDFLVYDALLVCLAEFFRRVLGIVVLLADTVENRAHEHIVEVAFAFLDLFQ